MELFEGFDSLLKTFWYVAIPTSVIFGIQTILTFVGADATDGVEVDFDGDLGEVEAPFQLFSLRNLINFLLGFSWTGISFYNTITNHTLLIFLAIAVGVLFVMLFFMIIKQVRKLAENNSFNITNTVGKLAEVYLPIPANKTGKGKVMISVKGAYHELDAITESDKLPSGAMVKVARIESGNILVVTPA